MAAPALILKSLLTALAVCLRRRLRNGLKIRLGPLSGLLPLPLIIISSTPLSCGGFNVSTCRLRNTLETSESSTLHSLIRFVSPLSQILQVS